MHRFLVEALKKESGDAGRTLKGKPAAVRETGGYFENQQSRRFWGLNFFKGRGRNDLICANGAERGIT